MSIALLTIFVCEFLFPSLPPVLVDLITARPTVVQHRNVNFCTRAIRYDSVYLTYSKKIKKK